MNIRILILFLLLIPALSWGQTEAKEKPFRLERKTDGKLFLKCELLLLEDEAVIVRFERSKFAKIALANLSDASLKQLDLDPADFAEEPIADGVKKKKNGKNKKNRNPPK
ncbi:MAG TPA: hypothetical protein DCR55_09950 [Lentisphaeria bacterium]|nr:hypothetical protein [Lentisphaeria bacterium]